MDHTTKVNDILNEVSHLSLDEQGFIVETVNNRIHEARRDKIAQRAREAEKNLKNGDVTTGTVNDLMKSLNND